MLLIRLCDERQDKNQLKAGSIYFGIYHEKDTAQQDGKIQPQELGGYGPAGWRRNDHNNWEYMIQQDGEDMTTRTGTISHSVTITRQWKEYQHFAHFLFIPFHPQPTEWYGSKSGSVFSPFVKTL